MRTSYHIAFAVADRYDVLYIGEDNDTGVGQGVYVDFEAYMDLLLYIVVNRV
jgi:hypothetical protein